VRWLSVTYFPTPGTAPALVRLRLRRSILDEDKPGDYLLVGAEEVVIGGVRYERLLTDIGERGAPGSRSGSSLGI